jgi:hypothetical protein
MQAVPIETPFLFGTLNVLLKAFEPSGKESLRGGLKNGDRLRGRTDGFRT